MISWSTNTLSPYCIPTLCDSHLSPLSRSSVDSLQRKMKDKNSTTNRGSPLKTLSDKKFPLCWDRTLNLLSIKWEYCHFTISDKFSQSQRNVLWHNWKVWHKSPTFDALFFKIKVMVILLQSPHRADYSSYFMGYLVFP